MVWLFCNIVATIIDRLFVGPLWFVASFIAAQFFPYEESTEHWALSLVLTFVLGALLVAGLYFMFF